MATNSLLDTDFRAVPKKMRGKTFARNVTRDDLGEGAEESIRGGIR